VSEEFITCGTVAAGLGTLSRATPFDAALGGKSFQGTQIRAGDELSSRLLPKDVLMEYICQLECPQVLGPAVNPGN
jgi:hypothetical protein